MFPPTPSRTRRTCSLSTSSMVRKTEDESREAVPRPRCSTRMTPPVARARARVRQFSNSRTFPGQAWDNSASLASLDRVGGFR